MFPMEKVERRNQYIVTDRYREWEPVFSAELAHLWVLPSKLSPARMAIESDMDKNTSLRRALFFSGAASLAVLTAAPLGAAKADQLTDTYQALQKNPLSVPLNLKYGALAERAGKLKWALPAYERALAAEPSNKAASDAIDRIRAELRREAAGK